MNYATKMNLNKLFNKEIKVKYKYQIRINPYLIFNNLIIKKIFL